MKLGVIAVMNNFPPIFVDQSFPHQAEESLCQTSFRFILYL